MLLTGIMHVNWILRGGGVWCIQISSRIRVNIIPLMKLIVKSTFESGHGIMTFCPMLLHCKTKCNTWMRVFRIIPEFRISRLTFHTFHRMPAPKNPELGRF